jgi:bacteriocin-associated integral membrane protein
VKEILDLKKLIIFFLVISFSLSIFVSFDAYDQKERKQMYLLEQKIGSVFFMPDGVGLSDPNDIYPILLSSSSEMNINLIRPAINNKPNQQMELVKYILLNGPTTLFNYITLKSREYLSTEQTKSDKAYLSTSQDHSAHQIGIIQDFAGNDSISVRPLRSSFDYLPVSGYYYIEGNQDKLASFLERLAENTNQYFKTNNMNITVSPQTFMNMSSPSDVYSVTSNTDIQLLYYVLVIITVFFVLYYTFQETKRLGIYKLFGYSLGKMWFESIGKSVVYVFCTIMLLSILLAFFIPGSSSRFIYDLIYQQCLLCLVIVVLTMPAYTRMARFNVIHAIKNKKGTSFVLFINLLLKVVVTIVVISSSVNMVTNYKAVKNEESALRQWQKSNKFGVFYPVNIGYDSVDFQNGSTQFIRTTTNYLYPLLNQMGSVLVNARSYETTALELDQNYEGHRSLSVNPNYLNEFPVHDDKGQMINISENETDWIILVPERLKGQQQEILSFFQTERKQRVKFDKQTLGVDVPETVASPKIRIIWTTDGQEVFSFNTDVYPQNNNNILDPIIQVVTLKNSLLGDRDAILGGGSTDPLKVKLIDGDTQKTYMSMKSSLRQLKLDDNLHYVITVDQYIATKLYHLKAHFYTASLSLVISMFILILLLLQNVSIVFSKYQQKFIIRGIFGLSIPRKYKEFFVLFIVTWTISLLGVIYTEHAYWALAILICFSLLALELWGSLVWLKRIWRKHITQVIKGGGQ